MSLSIFDQQVDSESDNTSQASRTTTSSFYSIMFPFFAIGTTITMSTQIDMNPKLAKRSYEDALLIFVLGSIGSFSWFVLFVLTLGKRFKNLSFKMFIIGGSTCILLAFYLVNAGLDSLGCHVATYDPFNCYNESTVFFKSDHEAGKLFRIAILAGAEEFLKLGILALLVSLRNSVQAEPVGYFSVCVSEKEYILLAAALGFGFEVIENLIYFSRHSAMSGGIETSIGRNVFPLHPLFSSLAALGWVSAVKRGRKTRYLWFYLISASLAHSFFNRFGGSVIGLMTGPVLFIIIVFKYRRI